MDLKKRIEKLEGQRTPVRPTPPVDTEVVRELTIEEWNELYVKPMKAGWVQKPTANGGSE